MSVVCIVMHSSDELVPPKFDRLKQLVSISLDHLIGRGLIGMVRDDPMTHRIPAPA
jgi:hypothetical protein